ncbi:hypothetical protein [Variovorax guangxiensis]|nr:hypothetical protein [Variovorax guangxiensis]MDR6861272.1 hypothetical protein [Variovorax guangxiensis]
MEADVSASNRARSQVLNGELRASFEKWYPRFGALVQEPLAA